MHTALLCDALCKELILRLCSQWRREEILPYIIDLNGKPDALLLKHTRVTRVPVPGGKPEDETKMYSSRQ